MDVRPIRFSLSAIADPDHKLAGPTWAICSVVAAAGWLGGALLANSLFSAGLALLFPPYAYYLVVEKAVSLLFG
jgi:hypothetical protein